jgi:predicted DsbA family dithiol-disulfide isomerase
MTQAGDPPTAMELRAESLGIKFTRGRSWSSNSYLALEASEFADGRREADALHKRLFKAYFEELADIGDLETVVRLGTEAGLPAPELRDALTSRAFRQQVDDGINWSRSIGVTGVPTFILDERTGLVGAQPPEVFEEVLRELGKVPRA